MTTRPTDEEIQQCIDAYSDAGASIADMFRAWLAERQEARDGVVVTKNEAGHIVTVTRQDEDGRILKVIAESTSPQPQQAESDGEVRLWDTQWMKIVNHDNSYRNWSKYDAVAHAVKMTEAEIARNVYDGKLPPRTRAAPAYNGKKEGGGE